MVNRASAVNTKKGTLEGIKPERLPIVLGRKDGGVEKDKNNNKPIEPLRLDHSSTHLG